MVEVAAAPGVPVYWTRLQSTCWSSICVEVLLLLLTQHDEDLMLGLRDSDEGLDDLRDGQGPLAFPVFSTSVVCGENEQTHTHIVGM